MSQGDEDNKKNLFYSISSEKNQLKLDLSKSLLNFYNNKFNCKKSFLKNLYDIKSNYILYTGEFFDNKFHGYGHLYYNEKKSYIGQFFENYITDEGNFYFN